MKADIINAANVMYAFFFISVLLILQFYTHILHLSTTFFTIILQVVPTEYINEVQVGVVLVEPLLRPLFVFKIHLCVTVQFRMAFRTQQHHQHEEVTIFSTVLAVYHVVPLDCGVSVALRTHALSRTLVLNFVTLR
jgi:hypothetical protein